MSTLNLDLITVHLERGRTVAFSDLPARSIALDGYVSGPAIDPALQRYSFDHHSECVRMVTSATCKQVLDALVLGLDPEDFDVYANQVSGDTALAVALLSHPEWAESPAVHELVRVVGDFDAHGPAYRSSNPALLQAFWHAMAPEREQVESRTYATCDLIFLMQQCVARIEQLVEGTLDTGQGAVQRSYNVEHRADTWVLVEGQGYVHDLAYSDGFRRVVSFTRENDGSYGYTIGKASEFVAGFPIGPVEVEGTLLHRLASIEPGWGGSATIGGAPRHADGSRSRLSPRELIDAIEDVLTLHSPARAA